MKRSYHSCWRDEKRRFHSMKHHRLDPYLIPKDKAPLYVNEPWLIRKQRNLSERLADICNIDLTQEELYKVNRENGELISIQNQ